MSPRLLAAAALAAALAGCGPKAPRMVDPTALRSFCTQQYVPRLGAIENIVTSVRNAPPAPSGMPVARLVAGARTKTGVEATWDDVRLLLPAAAHALGESDDYVRVRRAIIANVPDNANPPRRIDLEVRDRGAYRWYAFEAYSTQNVCVEGERMF